MKRWFLLLLLIGAAAAYIFWPKPAEPRTGAAERADPAASRAVFARE